MFENAGEQGATKKKKNSGDSKPGTDDNKKQEFSLKELAKMDVSELSSKVFTFEKKLQTTDLTKV